jgi:hypothetical protein
LVLAERILNRVRKFTGTQGGGPVAFRWRPLDEDDVQDWEKAAQIILLDVSQNDYQGASTSFDYLVATSTDRLEVAQLIGAFVLALYFLKNPQNSPETA